MLRHAAARHGMPNLPRVVGQNGEFTFLGL